jgi:hypothetical protein
MSTIYSLVLCIISGLAGWFLYRNPVRILDFVFGKDEGQWRPIRFFQIFGVVVMVLAVLSAVITVAVALLKGLA